MMGESESYPTEREVMDALQNARPLLALESRLFIDPKILEDIQRHYNALATSARERNLDVDIEPPVSTLEKLIDNIQDRLLQGIAEEQDPKRVVKRAAKNAIVELGLKSDVSIENHKIIGKEATGMKWEIDLPPKDKHKSEIRISSTLPDSEQETKITGRVQLFGNQAQVQKGEIVFDQKPILEFDPPSTCMEPKEIAQRLKQSPSI